MADTPAPVERKEIATTRDGRDITRGFVDSLPLLPPQDSILQGRGAGSYAIYDEVLRDDQVKSTLEQRRLAVVSREWEVRPGGTMRRDKQAATALQEELTRIGWDRITDRMLFGVFYGFAVAEVLWARDGARVAIDDIKVRNARRFAFAPDGALRLLTSAQPNGEALPPRKFWTYCAGSHHDDEPYGLALAHWLYWPVFFKRNGLKFWLIFLEKFGQPTGVGRYPGGTTPEEQQKLLDAVGAIQTDSGIIVPEGMMVELLEASRSGTADYTALYDRMDLAISKVTVGQTMTTDSGSSRSQAEVHLDVRQDLIKADADLVCESFNRSVARWYAEWNFPGAAAPQVWRRIDDEPDLKPQAERDKIIVDMGFRPTLKYVTDTYGGEWTEKRAPEPLADLPTGNAPPPQDDAAARAAFADGDPELHPGDAHAERLAEDAAPHIREWLEAIEAMVSEAKDLPALRDRLLGAFAHLPDAQLAAAMQLGFAAADLAGRFDADVEARAARG